MPEHQPAFGPANGVEQHDADRGRRDDGGEQCRRFEVCRRDDLLDLCYEEDSRAEVDANIVLTDKGRFVEFQATAEHKSFDDDQMDQMRNLARIGVADLITLQQSVIDAA